MVIFLFKKSFLETCNPLKCKEKNTTFVGVRFKKKSIFFLERDRFKFTTLSEVQETRTAFAIYFLRFYPAVSLETVFHAWQQEVSLFDRETRFLRSGFADFQGCQSPSSLRNCTHGNLLTYCLYVCIYILQVFIY